MKKTRATHQPNTVVSQGLQIVGWIGPANTCTRPDCKRAQKEGRPYHAIPRDGFLADYHFTSIEKAQAALIAHAGVVK
jgi:hypothetical protein